VFKRFQPVLFGLFEFDPEMTLSVIDTINLRYRDVIAAKKGTCEPVPNNLVTANKISRSLLFGLLFCCWASSSWIITRGKHSYRDKLTTQARISFCVFYRPQRNSCFQIFLCSYINFHQNWYFCGLCENTNKCFVKICFRAPSLFTQATKMNFLSETFWWTENIWMYSCYFCNLLDVLKYIF
jgi:hypothetical protein